MHIRTLDRVPFVSFLSNSNEWLELVQLESRKRTKKLPLGEKLRKVAGRSEIPSTNLNANYVPPQHRRSARGQKLLYYCRHHLSGEKLGENEFICKRRTKKRDADE